ncbi:hypothetical protein IFR05_016507, partial [Cadophora sp. M221]
MDPIKVRKERTSYPSRLVDSKVDFNLLNAPPRSSPESLDTVPELLANSQKREADSLGSPDATPLEQKRQRTQTNDELLEDAQRRLMDAINIEAQKIHGEDSKVFPDHFLQLSPGSANSIPTPIPDPASQPQRRGRGRPRKAERKAEPAPGPFVPPLVAFPQVPLSVIARLTPGGDQYQQKLPPVGLFVSGESVPHPADQHPGPPIPTFGGVPQYSLPGFTPGYEQQQYLPATSASSTYRLLFPEDQKYDGHPAPISGGVPQNPQPDFATPLSQIQAQSAIATEALRGTSQEQAQVSDSGSPSFSPIIRYTHSIISRTAHQSQLQEQAPAPIAGPLPNNSRKRRQTVRPDIGNPTPASRRASRKANSSVKGASTSQTPTATQPQAQQVAQPIFGTEIRRIGGIQPPYFTQDWPNNLTQPADTPQPNTNSSSGTANTVVVGPMELLAITDGANKAWAAHGTARPSLSLSPFPPPEDSEDIRHAGGRMFHSWMPGKAVYLSAAFNKGNDPAANTITYFPIDWDLAFYHSRRLAWFYSENTGNSPTSAFPIKISFAATGYILMN